jgi:hypothetical protein
MLGSSLARGHACQTVPILAIFLMPSESASSRNCWRHYSVLSVESPTLKPPPSLTMRMMTVPVLPGTVR